MPTGRSLVLCLPLVLAAACGSRTGLLLPVEGEVSGPDAGDDALEPADATGPFDAPDDLPGIDVVIPKDGPSDCPDAGSTFIYLISEQNVLLSFYPPTASFHTIGTIACPTSVDDAPFSMAVDREGVAYVVFSPSGRLFKVSTLTAACEATPFEPGTGGFPRLFGMGFSQDTSDPNETLYVAGDPDFGSSTEGPAILGSIDTTTYALRRVGTITPNILGAELTGTGSGQLFAFFSPDPTEAPSYIGEIDKTSAQVLAVSELAGVAMGGGWAFGFWGGDFYMFTAPGGDDEPSVVSRYDPNDRSLVEVASTPHLTIVGAGVSTCAPQR